MKMFSAVSRNVVKLMDATSVLINSVHDVCTMAEVATSAALKDQQLQSDKDLSNFAARLEHQKE